MISQNLKHRAYHEMKEGLVIALYLWVVFGLLTIHKSMILADYHIEFAAHGIALFNALALQGHGRCKKAPPGRPVR